jgi:hypothetical protein
MLVDFLHVSLMTSRRLRFGLNFAILSAKYAPLL